MAIAARKASEMAPGLQRFLISGPDLRIDAGFSPEMPISVRQVDRPACRSRCGTGSASDSNIRCRKEEWFRLLRPWRQRFSASDSNLRWRNREWFRLLRSWRQRSSASDSNFRCSREEWFRLLRPWRQRSSASNSNFRCRREEWFRL